MRARVLTGEFLHERPDGVFEFRTKGEEFEAPEERVADLVSRGVVEAVEEKRGPGRPRKN